jgi:hypothetical protein
MKLKQPARIITTAWGKSYLDELLSVALPALIAPGNLPALAQLFECEFVLVTETAFFESVRNASIFQQIEKICKARLVSLDDLVMTRLHYGMALTYAYMRGFQDLGDRVTDWYLIFLNSDFVLADGSYRLLAQRMLAGERLIVAPSYCVVEERLKPLLRYVLTDPQTNVLAIPPREMAALAIPNRHYTIRGKTVNQQIYSMDRIEQFYWYVDDHTLLAHQLPIAVVCMKPERAVATLETFWDYGLVSEFCPTIKPCVLDDSDDFLMIEIRSENTYAEYLSLGWPSLDEIAADLSSFTTKDHRDYGRYTLILHSDDIPDSVYQAKASLRAFVDNVYSRMSSEPCDHLKHPYWMASHTDFHRAKAFYQASQSTDVPRPDPSQYLRKGGELPASLGSCGLLWRILAWTQAALIGHPSCIGKSHPYWDDLSHALQILEKAFQTEDRKVLFISPSEQGSFILPGVAKAANTYARVDEFYAVNDFLERVIGPESNFDTCVIEVNFDTLLYFPNLFRAIRPRLKKRGKVIALYLNTYDRPVYKKNLTMMKNYFTSTDGSRVYFSGTAMGVRAKRLFNSSLVLRQRGNQRGLAAAIVLMLLSIGLAFVANRWTDSGSPHRFPKILTGLTVEIDIT